MYSQENGVAQLRGYSQQEYSEQQNRKSRGGGFDFAAEPQAIQSQSQYRDPNEAGYILKDQTNRNGKSNNNQVGSRSEQNWGGESQEFQNQIDTTNQYELIDEPTVDEGSIIPYFYVDRPPTPEYKPVPPGIDKQTQIDPVDDDLFDFEIQVEPILELIVGKTMLQSRMELIQDYEDQQLRKHRAHFEKRRNAELMVTQRMENRFLRETEEKERRQLQHKYNRDQNQLMHQKLICRLLTQKALSSVKPISLNDMENLGFLKDDINMDIHRFFVPWLVDQSTKQNSNTSEAKVSVDALIKQVEREPVSLHNYHFQQEMNRRKAILQDRARIQREKQEYRDKKAEWQRKQALKAAREILFSEIEKQVINKPEKTDNILSANITDIFGDVGNKPVAAVFGGALGQLCLVLDAVENSILVEEEKIQIQTQQILDFLLALLNSNLKELVLNLGTNVKDCINVHLKRMEDDLLEFNEEQEGLLTQLVLDGDSYFISPTQKFLRQKFLISQRIVQSVFYSLFDIYFQSINYQLPDISKLEESKLIAGDGDASGQQISGIIDENAVGGVDSSVVKDPPGGAVGDESREDQSHLVIQQPEKPPAIEISQIQHDMVAARGKLLIDFDETQLKKIQRAKAFLRIRIPFVTQEELQNQTGGHNDSINVSQGRKDNSIIADDPRQSSQQMLNVTNNASLSNLPAVNDNLIEEQNKEDQQEEKIDPPQQGAKYEEFVEIYDGEGYLRDYAEKSIALKKRNIGEDDQLLFNPQLIPKLPMLLLDERSTYFLRSGLLDVIRKSFGEKLPNSFDETTFWNNLRQTDENIDKQFLPFYVPDREKIPIFDPEY